MVAALRLQLGENFALVLERLVDLEVPAERLAKNQQGNAEHRDEQDYSDVVHLNLHFDFATAS